MAIGVMNWVWTHSRSRHGARLVLLAIADCASGDGSNAWPSVAELRRKAGLGERAVQSAIAELVTLGELQVEYNAGPKGCNRYRVLMTTTPADSAPPQNLHPPANNAPPQNLRGSASSQDDGQNPARSAPPAESAPPQNSTGTPAESAPVTIKDPSMMIDHLDALANRLADIPGEDDLILKVAISMIHERTGQVIDAARARAIVASILNGRRTTDREAYVKKAIRNEKNPRGRFLADDLPPAGATLPEWCGKCHPVTRMRESDDGTPSRCPECKPKAKAS